MKASENVWMHVEILRVEHFWLEVFSVGDFHLPVPLPSEIRIGLSRGPKFTPCIDIHGVVGVESVTTGNHEMVENGRVTNRLSTKMPEYLGMQKVTIDSGIDCTKSAI
jgi:hypothetical protein